MRKGQLTVELMIILGFVMILLTPALFYLTQSYVDVIGEYENNKIHSYAEHVLANAELLYFNGLYSKMTVTPSVKTSNYKLNNVFTLETRNNSGFATFALVYNISNSRGVWQHRFYYTDIPVQTNYTCTANPVAEFPACNGVNLNCKKCLLNVSKFITEDLRMEVVQNNTYGLMVQFSN
ncbi:hypothetical protein H6504_02330 [Candidatus Woesearchaeota archaeon]|nr:hypothetical protein [Candidatus Woesearchaeota archaeon]